MRKRMAGCFLALFLISFPWVSVGPYLSAPETGTLRGNVKYAFDNAPLDRAFVFVHGEFGTGDRVVKLDKGAEFEINLAPGFYDVLIACNGFVPVCKRFYIERGQTTDFAPRLQADHLHTVVN